MNGAGLHVVSHNQQLGRDGENVAAHVYRRDGYTVVATNWRCPRGELDLIVSKGGVMVFVEVKTRSSDRYGSPAEAVGLHKQRKVKEVASAFLREHVGPRPAEIRFDVAAVTPGPHGLGVELIRDAF